MLTFSALLSLMVNFALLVDQASIWTAFGVTLMAPMLLVAIFAYLCRSQRQQIGCGLDSK